MSREMKQVAAGAILFATGLIISGFETGRYVEPAVFLSAYLILGCDVIWSAAKKASRAQFMDMDFLMTVATVGALIIGQYPEAVAVMLFFKIGEMFEDHAVERSRGSISELMDIRPDYANLNRGDSLETVDPRDVEVGDTITIKPGEKIPLDGIVVFGTSSVDTKALTGESAPKDIAEGDEVLSGCINLNGTVKVTVTREYEDSTVSKVLELVENASSRKSHPEKFISVFARYYTPAVLAGAVLVALIPPLVFGEGWYDWIYRALIFIMVSCPCALVLSVPLTFFSGIGCASKLGILVKGSNYLEALSKVDTVVFDKTGTLTKGTFRVTDVNAVSVSGQELLELAAKAEHFSNHPISAAIKSAYDGPLDLSELDSAEEIAGEGIVADVGGKRVHIGNDRLMRRIGLDISGDRVSGTVAYVAADGVYAGSIVISDTEKTDAGRAVSEIRSMGIDNIVMLTGDTRSATDPIADSVGISTVYSELMPSDKVGKVEELMSVLPEGRKLIYVGDGINDAPVLARSDIGIAMGGLGSAAAIEAADVVIMTDEPSKIPVSMRIAKRTMGIVWQNLVFILAVKFTVLALTVLGYVDMWEGVFADVGVTFIAVFNATRAMGIRKVVTENTTGS